MLEGTDNSKDDEVCMIGICGQGGIGKSTLAMALYNELSQNFEGRCCFLSDIRENEKLVGLASLQGKFMSKIFGGSEPMNKDNGINLMKKRLGSNKVFLILDDVDHARQLEAFTANRRKNEEWFMPGSKIIVTTRNKEVLLQHGINEEDIYYPEGLGIKHSLQLFCRHAFSSHQPSAEFDELSRKVVKVAGGLPLALIVFGSFFYDIKDKREWEDKLEILKRDQHEDILKRLRISYDGLHNHREKCVFLDIACFFIGWHKEHPVYMWEGCGYAPNTTLKVLQHRSLIKINEGGFLEMHDQIRDMGRMIVQEEGSNEPLKYSRLWIAEDVSKVSMLRDNNIQGLHWSGDDIKRLRWEAMEAMPSLRTIIAGAVDTRTENQEDASQGEYGDGGTSDNEEASEGEEMRLPKSTKLLCWRWCRRKTLTFHNGRHEHLLVLDLQYGQFRRLESLNMAFPMLKALDLSHCSSLIRTPEFTHLDCHSLVELDESIGQLKALVFLSMKS
ncbi:disease resistance protein RUN1-like isoform X2 [Nymphaea colorata]|uniref:disease resistance protein RUN1-like isoform X2 n=1 Tax=Nymphaea colorata TaxID=210225 RepID=UPI00129D2677|nr:disease resistance protein RUN1-like isoform X2 [Nymphaea colorata]